MSNSNIFMARLQNEPALFSPETADRVTASLMALAEHDHAVDFANAADDEDDFWPEEDHWKASFRPYKVKAGILQIPVQGVLLNNFPYQFGGWATGYEYIAKAMERGLADPEVNGIALIIDSPGGMVAGNFDLVDGMFAQREQKPIRAYAADSAYSAAYSIASAADSITVTRSGGVGSIGVVTAHWDLSKALEKEGYKVTFIHAGKHKVDGNPYEPLPDAVKARIQERIDVLYDEFVSIVARNRGMDEKAVRKTEALTFTGPQAVSNGLADFTGKLDDAVAAFAVELSTNQGERTMSKNQDNQAAVFDQAAVDSARADGVKEGTQTGAKAERERITAIIGLDEAATRRDAAFNIACKTDLSVDAAKGLLATLPEDKKADSAEDKSAKSGKSEALFDAAMGNTKNPEVGSEGGESKKELSESAQILADYGQGTGYTKKAD